MHPWVRMLLDLGLIVLHIESLSHVTPLTYSGILMNSQVDFILFSEYQKLKKMLTKRELIK